jgi:hypothetical protein
MTTGELVLVGAFVSSAGAKLHFSSNKTFGIFFNRGLSDNDADLGVDDWPFPRTTTKKVKRHKANAMPIRLSFLNT